MAPRILKPLEAGDDGHTIARCERALSAATALAAGQGDTQTVLERYWTRQLNFARARREWRWGDET